MLVVNLRTVQKWLSKVGLLFTISMDADNYRLDKFYLLWEKDWEKKFKGENDAATESTIQPRLPGLD